MEPRDAELLAKLLPTFRQEADEHLRRIGALLATLEKEPAGAAVEEAFREAHSLKGAARAVGAGELEALCQQLETVFAALKKEQIGLPRNLLDLLYLAADLAADLARQAGRELPAELATLQVETGRRLGEAAQGRTVELPPRPAPTAAEASEEPAGDRRLPETLRVDSQRIEGILRQAEELLGDKLAARRQTESLRELPARLAALRRTLAELAAAERPETGSGRQAERRRDLLRRQSALAGSDAELRQLEGTLRQIIRESEEHDRSLGARTDQLLETVRSTLMLPVALLIEQFPRIARDLMRETGKQLDIELAGGEILLDRRILEEMRDPLLHLLRNAIDHGIEEPRRRREKGKAERGTIRLEVTAPTPRRILFTLTDDGRGLDFPSLKAAAVHAGVVSAEEAAALDDWQTAELAFTSGVSTQDRVTTVSGRGLGLPIVRERAERLGGTVQVAARRDAGTTFRIEVPAALAAFRGILVRLGSARFVFPAQEVVRVLRLPAERIAVVENRDILELEGRVLPVVRLETPLSLPLPMRGGREILSLVLTAAPTGAVAFAVDEILGEEELLVKNLGKPLRKVANYTGAALLGDGGIALILDPGELLRSAATAGAPAAAPREETPEPVRRRVLVVEDSITSRTLLRNILEGAGYDVVTAVDGVDALHRLTSAAFDVVVSDVEMPRLDGFGLTRRIRESYGRLPVVLVTGLENPEDRERGLEAGADAYIVKSRFDQGNLLETLGRIG